MNRQFKRTMSISQLCWREAAAAAAAAASATNNRQPIDKDDGNDENTRFRGEKRSFDFDDIDTSNMKTTGDNGDDEREEQTTTKTTTTRCSNHSYGKKSRTSLRVEVACVSDKRECREGEDPSPSSNQSNSLQQLDGSTSNNVFYSLSDDTLINIFKFVGCGHYFFVGGTCHRFNSIYRKVYGNTNKKKKKNNKRGSSSSSNKKSMICDGDDNNNSSDDNNSNSNNFRNIYDFLLNFDADDKSITTSMKSVVESVSRAKVYLNQVVLESNNHGWSNLQQWENNEAKILQKLGNAAFLHKKYDVLQYVLEQPGAAMHILHPAVTKGKIP